MFVPVASTIRSTLMVVGRLRLGDTETGDVNLAQPSSPLGRAGYDHDRVSPELEHVIGSDHNGRADEARLAS